MTGGQFDSWTGAGGLPVELGTGQQFGDSHPIVVKPLAAFLRGYQLDGGYTPGPLLLASLLAGLAGSAFLLRRRRPSTDAAEQRGRPDTGRRDTARACCYLLGSGVVLLLLADAFEFSWRYQQPAVVILPPAGALGITLIIGYLRGLRGSRRADSRAEPSPAQAGSGAAGTAR